MLVGNDGAVTTTAQGKPGIGQGSCTNSGDGHIRYDQLAKRWLFTTPSFTRVGGQYAMCYAVSTGTDPTGTVQPLRLPPLAVPRLPARRGLAGRVLQRDVAPATR